MKTKTLSLLFIGIMMLAMVAALSAGEQTKCPVMGGEIDKSLYVEQDGKRIYVCCEGCIEELEKNFSTYEAKLIESGQTVELVSATDTKDDCGTGCDGSKKIEQAEAKSASCEKTAVKVSEKDCGSGNCGSKEKGSCNK